MNKLALTALLSVLLAACATKPAQDTAQVENKTTPVATTQPAPPATTDDAEARRLAEEQAAREAALRDQQNQQDASTRINENLLKSRSVYFGYDQYDIAEEYKSVIQTHSDFAKSSGNRVRIEGNTDDRGSREYNLALGQKRAAAVARAMQVLGVDESKIETVSNGEEKPTAEGADEEAWSVNRRADILYPDVRQ